MKSTVAVLNKHKDSSVDQVLEVLDAINFRRCPLHYGLITLKKELIDRSTNLLRKQGLISSTTAGYASSRPKTVSDYNIVQFDDAALLFEGKIYTPTLKTALTEQVAKQPLNYERTLQTLIAQADGDYMFLLLREGWIVAGRDPIGVNPLYFGENSEIAAFATNRDALWKLGILNPESFPPGNLGFADKNGFRFKTVKNLPYLEPAPVTLDKAADTLQFLIVESIQRRVYGLKEVIVAFSGGLDSSVVAFLAKRQGIKVNLLHVSLENEPETEEAIEAARALDLPLQVYLFKDSDVEATLPSVVELIEDSDPVKASIGVPFFWVAEKATEDGFKTLLAGQGADELFGGYQRYVNEYCSKGHEMVYRIMFNDLVNIHKNNLERDLKITNFFDIDLRLPFASFDIAEFALGLPIECKLENKLGTLRKLVLRKVAQNVGLPAVIAEKPKKAVQYSTGINDAIKRIAKKKEKTVKEYIDELFKKAFISS